MRARLYSNGEMGRRGRIIPPDRAALGRQAGQQQADGMGGWNFQTRQRLFAEILSSCGARSLAVFLAAMSQSSSVLGMPPGSLSDQAHARLGTSNSRPKALGGLVSVAEALGRRGPRRCGPAIGGGSSGRRHPRVERASPDSLRVLD